jgi:predicted  nucleic acid-binding Zn-ribbon protein
LEKAREDLTGAEVELAEAELELRTIPEQIRDKQNAITSEREKLATKDDHDKKLVRVRAVISEAEGNIRSVDR